MAKGITQEQIFGAAQALSSRGESVTIANVRRELGDTGSFSTIHENLRTWRERHRPDQPPAISEALDEVGGAMRKVWSAAWGAAQSAFSFERENLEAAQAQLQAERGELLAEILRLEEELEAANTKMNNLFHPIKPKLDESVLVELVTAAPVPLATPAEEHKRTKKST